MIDSGPQEFRAVGNRDWELVDSSTGEYRSVKRYEVWQYLCLRRRIRGYMGRVILVPYESAKAFRAGNDVYSTSHIFYVGPGVFYDPADERIHIRLAKTRDMRAAEARSGTVFPTDHPDPRKHFIILSSAQTTLTVRGAHLVLKDLTFHQAKNTILMSPEASSIRFDGITAWVGDSVIEAHGGGIHHVTITRSRIYGDNPYWIFWSDMKDPPAPANLLRSTAIDLRDGTHDWEISYNHLRGSGQDLISTNTNEDRVFAHHNRMENCGDDAFELEGTSDVGEIRV